MLLRRVLATTQRFPTGLYGTAEFNEEWLRQAVACEKVTRQFAILRAVGAHREPRPKNWIKQCQQRACLQRLPDWDRQTWHRLRKRASAVGLGLDLLNDL